MTGHPPAKAKNGLAEAFARNRADNPVLAQMSERSYNKRHVLFMPHHDENLIFLVKSGRLRVYLGLNGKEISLALLGPGDVYCTHTRAYVEALEPTTILACPIGAFISLASQEKAFVPALMGSIGTLMNGVITIIENLYFNCTDKRVAVFFHEQALSSGRRVEDGIYVKVGLTVDNIAKIVGSSRQTVSTLISSMEKDGIIKKLGRGEYLIRDMDELDLLANSCTE